MRRTAFIGLLLFAIMITPSALALTRLEIAQQVTETLDGDGCGVGQYDVTLTPGQSYIIVVGVDSAGSGPNPRWAMSRNGAGADIFIVHKNGSITGWGAYSVTPPSLVYHTNRSSGYSGGFAFKAAVLFQMPSGVSSFRPYCDNGAGGGGSSNARYFRWSPFPFTSLTNYAQTVCIWNSGANNPPESNCQTQYRVSVAFFDLLTAPSNLTASSGQTVSLSWTASTGSFSSQKIYRRETGGGSFSLYATTGTNTTWVDNNGTPGTFYDYCVSAVGATESDCSNVASAQFNMDIFSDNGAIWGGIGVDGVAEALGINETATKLWWGLFLIIPIVVFSGLIQRSINGGVSIGGAVGFFLGMLVDVYIGFWPVWVPFMIGVIMAGVFAIKMKIAERRAQ